MIYLDPKGTLKTFNLPPASNENAEPSLRSMYKIWSYRDILQIHTAWSFHNSSCLAPGARKFSTTVWIL